MNYSYQSAVSEQKEGRNKQIAAFDYSRFDGAPLNERKLNESTGLKWKTVADEVVLERLARDYVGIAY